MDKRPFPVKLHDMLEISSLTRCPTVSWTPDGKSFVILNRDRFMNDLVPLFFKQTKFRSFTRQLNLWGFQPISLKGYRNQVAWCHEHFIRGEPHKIQLMDRTQIKGSVFFLSSTTRVVEPRDGRAEEQSSRPDLPSQKNGNEEKNEMHEAAHHEAVSSQSSNKTITEQETFISEPVSTTINPKPLSEADVFAPEEVLEFLDFYLKKDGQIEN